VECPLIYQYTLIMVMLTKENVAALLQWKEFLESTPAYVTRQFKNLVYDVAPTGMTEWGFKSPRIQLYCEEDDGIRGFDSRVDIVRLADEDWFLPYICRDCGHWRKTFAVSLSGSKNDPPVVTAVKLGEYPPFGSHVAKRLRAMLSDTDLELYRKGLRTEREGQGIGAAAYFRRVVDNQWKALVTKLRDAAAKLGNPAESLKVFDDALAQPQFKTAVEMLKDAIPPKLLILDGKNPLALLYKPLSIQLHNLSDAECLQQAADIRTVLNETFDNISRVLKDDEMLKAAVSRLDVPPAEVG
jgi:hypothetical protein